MQTLARSLRQSTAATTRRIITATVVSEQCLPYNLGTLDTPEKSYDFWHKIIATQPDHEPDKENLVVIVLNARLAPFAWHRVCLGTIASCNAHPREILRPVIASSGFGYILMHNHPSGDPTPSRADELTTRHMVEASAFMQITILDHVVIGQPSPGRTAWYSFREGGMIP